MLKKNFKILAILFVVLTVISSFSLCFADEEVQNETATTQTSEQPAEGTAEAKQNQEVHNGDLYVADIGLRDVLIVNTDTGKVERIAEEGDIPEKKIAYCLNADHGLITVARYYVKEYVGNYTYNYLTSCALGIEHVIFFYHHKADAPISEHFVWNKWIFPGIFDKGSPHRLNIILEAFGCIRIKFFISDIV